MTITDAIQASVVSNGDASEQAWPSYAGVSAANFTISLNTPAQTALVINYTVQGSAVSGLRYQALSGSVAFDLGDSAHNVTVVPIQDNIAEGTETVILTLESASETNLLMTVSVATLNILDWTVLSVTAISDASQVGPVNGVFTVSMSAPAVVATTVTFSLGGTAVSGVDYDPFAASTVAFAIGDATQTIDVSSIVYLQVGGPKTVVLTLTDFSPPLYEVLGAASVATVVIFDRIIVSVQASDASAVGEERDGERERERERER